MRVILWRRRPMTEFNMSAAGLWFVGMMILIAAWHVEHGLKKIAEALRERRPIEETADK
jgi:hypothetical protein